MSHQYAYMHGSGRFYLLRSKDTYTQQYKAKRTDYKNQPAGFHDVFSYSTLVQTLQSNKNVLYTSAVCDSLMDLAIYAIQNDNEISPVDKQKLWELANTDAE